MCGHVQEVRQDLFASVTLKAAIMTAADHIHKYFFIVFISGKIRPDVSSESSASFSHEKSCLIFFER